MGVYIPNMKAEQFYELCKQKGIEIIAIPAAEVRPVVKARWGEYEDELFGEIIKAYCCSNCHHLISRPTIVRNYCPRCGAKMEES